MPHDVFISYSSRDEVIADAVCAHLEAAGIRCWIAPRDLVGGLDWPGRIDRAIADSRVMVLVFSANSSQSRQVKHEVGVADRTGTRVIPFRIEDVSPGGSMRNLLARAHWLDAINPPTERQIQTLVDTVRWFLEYQDAAGTSGEVAPAGPPRLPPVGATLWRPALGSVDHAPRRPQARPTGPIARHPWLTGMLLSVAVVTALVGPRLVPRLGLPSIGSAPGVIAAPRSSPTPVAATPSATPTADWQPSPAINAQNATRLGLRSTLEAHSQIVLSVAVSPDGRAIASGACDACARLWDARGGRQTQVWIGRAPVNGVAFSPDGKLLAMTDSASVRLWDVAASQELRVLPGQGQRAQGLAFSPDGKALAVGYADSTVVFYDVASGKELRTLPVQGGSSGRLAFSPDGSLLVTHGGGGVQLLEAATGNRVRLIRDSGGWETGLAFSPDGKVLAIAGYTGARLVDLTSSGDGRWLPSSAAGDPVSGGCATQLQAAFTPDGSVLVAGGARGPILWDVATGKELTILTGHAGRANAVAVSGDGQLLVSGGEDGTLKLWGVKQ